jgi:hypothetical protein
MRESMWLENLSEVILKTYYASMGPVNNGNDWTALKNTMRIGIKENSYVR